MYMEQISSCDVAIYLQHNKKNSMSKMISGGWIHIWGLNVNSAYVGGN